MENASDQDLVRQTLSGDVRSFEKIVKRYQYTVFGIAFRLLKNKEEAEDITQEAFLRCYQNLDKFDQRRPFAPWIRRIASNLALSRLRQQRLRQLLPWDYVSRTFSRHQGCYSDPERALENVDDRQEMAGYLQKLKPIDQLVVILRYYEELDYEEIAYILNTTRNNVEVRLSRARRKLRRLIAESQGEVKKCSPAEKQKNSSISTSTESWMR